MRDTKQLTVCQICRTRTEEYWLMACRMIIQRRLFCCKVRLVSAVMLEPESCVGTELCGRDRMTCRVVAFFIVVVKLVWVVWSL